MVAVSSSAPTFPWRASPSESLVNPEMSTNATVPVTVRQRSPGAFWIQSMASRGK